MLLSGKMGFLHKNYIRLLFFQFCHYLRPFNRVSQTVQGHWLYLIRLHHN